MQDESLQVGRFVHQQWGKLSYLQKDDLLEDEMGMLFVNVDKEDVKFKINDRGLVQDLPPSFDVRIETTRFPGMSGVL